MWKRKRTWILTLILILLAAAFGYQYLLPREEADADAEPELKTAVVRQGDITISATGAGTVVPADEISLSFPGGGTLTQLLVKVGDKVAAGDLLAVIDDTDAQAAVANAQLALAQASLQTDPDRLQRAVASAQINVDAAALNVETAQTELDDLLSWEPDEEAVALAQANLDAAQASYDAALSRDAASGSSLTASSISIDQAVRALADAEAAYETAFDPGREWELNMTDPTCSQGQGGAVPCTGPSLSSRLQAERAGAENSLLRAQENLTIARANYNVAAGNLNQDSAVSAQSGLLNARIALENALTGPSDAQITAARARLQNAQLSLRQAELNLAAAQDNSQAELSRSQALLNLESAQRNLEATNLTAPVDGTILAVAASVGENAAAPLITLADLSQPLLDIYIDQTDMDKIGVGFEVDVIFDALPDDSFSGEIIQLYPQLSTVGGVSAVRALARLDSRSFAKPQTLPVGMNATVDVIGGRASDALLVPVEALRELSPGSYAVFVMENGAPKLRVVEVGLMDFTYAQILSGLEAGDVVTTGIVETE